MNASEVVHLHDASDLGSCRGVNYGFCNTVSNVGGDYAITEVSPGRRVVALVRSVPTMQSSDKAEPLLQPRRPSRRSATMGCCYCIFLVQYAVQFMISPFFPTSPAGEAIGIRLVGAGEP